MGRLYLKGVMMNITNTFVIVGITTVVVGAGGFYAGTKYQQSQLNRRFSQNTGRENIGQMMGGRGGQNAGGMLGMGRGMLVGEVTGIDDKSITLKLADGSSKIIIITDSTTYHMSVESKKDEVMVGTKIAVVGVGNSDGSTTAQRVELNPIQWGNTIK